MENEDKLAEIQAKKAEVDKRRRARIEKDEVETASAELARAELLDKFEAEHGAVKQGIDYVDLPNGEIVIVKKPAGATYRKFQDSKAPASEAFAALVKPCVLHPSKARYDELLEEFPALLLRAADAVVNLAGFRNEKT